VTNVCQVDGCARPTELNACWACVEWLGEDLDSVAELVAELETTAARQYSRATLGRGAESPLPFDPDASDALWCLANVAGTWAVHVARDRGVRVTWPRSAPGGGPGVARIAVVAAGWLSARLPLLRMSQRAGTAVDELRDAIRAARRAVDRSPSLAYAGTCGACSTVDHPAHLYARANEDGEVIRDVVICPTCGAEWSYVATRAALEVDALEHMATAAEIARAMPVLFGIELNVARVRQWGSRGRIPVCGHAANGRPLYRIGDVCDLLKRLSLTIDQPGVTMRNRGQGSSPLSNSIG
jgi:hypothetical protein